FPLADPDDHRGGRVHHHRPLGRREPAPRAVPGTGRRVPVSLGERSDRGWCWLRSVAGLCEAGASRGAKRRPHRGRLQTEPNQSNPVDAMTTTTTNPAIALHHLTKEFGVGETKTVALADIDLELPYGELVLLVGPSGCGKTTLISVVAGLLDASQGE